MMTLANGALALKPDWREAREQLTAWWHHDEVDRLCLGLFAPRMGAPDPATAPSREGMTPEEYYWNADLRIAEAEFFFAGYAALGATFPNASVDLGPGSLALYLGSTPGYDWHTVWFEPWSPAAEGALPEYDAQHPIWVRHQQMLQQLAHAARGRFLPNIPDLVEGLDIISSLRGNEELLLDLFDRPDWVHACQERLLDLYFRYYDRCYDICKDDDGGVAFTAFQVWAPGRLAKLQTDFSAMISPAMFDEFQLPYLRRMCRQLDYTLYHLDGPTALPHLDSLLSIEELNAIQWVPGTGANDVWHEQWYPYYRRILDAGKSLQLPGVYNPDGVDRIVKTFGIRGIYCHLWGVPTPEAGDEIMAYAERHWRQ